jgi:trans-aconitate methyltransferase
VIAADLSPGMLREAASHRGLLRRFDVLCTDATRLPLRTASVDLVFSNAALHWLPGHANLFPRTRNDYLEFVDRVEDHVPIIH